MLNEKEDEITEAVFQDLRRVSIHEAVSNISVLHEYVRISASFHHTL